MSTIMINNWLNIKEASRIMGVSADHVRLLARNSKITAVAASERCWLIDRDAAMAYAKKPSRTGRPRGSTTKSKK